MNKRIIPLMILPLFLFGCGKNKNVYASSKNTIYEFKLDGDSVIITGLNNNYKNQTDIIIPYSIDKHIVKRIDNYSFEDVYHIKSVDMSKSKLEEIGADAFKKCSDLSDVKFSNSITTIEEKAFEKCTKLQKLDMSICNVETISDEMFLNCSSLTEVKFPKATKTIGSNVFSGCESITELDYTDLNIEEIKNKAFYNLANLKDVKLSKTTKNIGDYAFSENKKIQFLNFKDTQIETIGEGAFSKCTILANINLPSTVKTIGSKAFYYCSKLGKLDLSKTSVEVIPESCFELCRSFDVNSISLSNVVSIESRAFYNSSLTKIIIPASTTTIADDAFRLCNKLEEIVVNADNNSFVIHNRALYTIDKTKLIAYPVANAEKEFTISSETAIINPYAFADAVNLETVSLESVNLTEIGGYTFMNCSNLKNLYLDSNATSGIKKIGAKAFFGCKSLTKFGKTRNSGDIYSITEIGESAFYDCINLEEVYLKESSMLTKIDDEAFYNCNKLITLTLPGSLKNVGRAAFNNASSVTTFSWGSTSNAFRDLVDKNSNSGLDQLLHFFN